MKRILLFLLTVTLAVFIMSCEEEKGSAYIYGAGTLLPGAGKVEFDGKMAHGGEQYWGECKTDSKGKFEFEIGHTDSTHLNIGEIYFHVFGVEGVGENGGPVLGVFEEGTTLKSGSSYFSTFKRSSITHSDTWVFEPDDSSDCKIELFAKAIPGELIPDNQKEFEYYLRLNCTGMDSVLGNNSKLPLRSVNLEFYFSNC